MTRTNASYRIGISSCLFGNDVRYDGTHRRQDHIRQALDPIAEWYIVCPELEAGLGVPRETIHLVGDIQNPRVQTTQTLLDKTQDLQALCDRKIKEIQLTPLSGFILKARSPSCGLEVGVTLDSGLVDPKGKGLFVIALEKHFPELPIVHEEHLATLENIQGFIAQMKRYNQSIAVD